MIKSLLSILNVVEGEEKPVLLLLGYGFFMGVFLAAYKVVATTLFLNQLSEYIREPFFISGVLGIVTTWLYASFQNWVQYSKLIVFNIISIFVFIAAAIVLFNLYYSEWLVFTLFVMLGPISSLLILGFWGIFGRMFDLRQSKRIIGGIDSGQLTAIIVTTFSIPFIIPYIDDITHILIIGEVGLIASIFFFVLISIRYPLRSFHEKQKHIRRETMFRTMFKNKYIIYLSMFLFLSMAAFVFVDYSFMNVTEQQYPDEKQLASFLGVFEGSIMILSLMIQTFANERILSMYGIRTSLLLLPVILFTFTALALVAGYIYGFDVSSPEFIWFFLFIALSKLFVSTLREATENPVFKLFFMPIDSRIRFDIQAKIEGTINEFSRAFSGGILLLLGLLPFFKLIHFSWILLVIIVGWVYLLQKIYHLYRVNIRLKLEKQKEEADKVEQKGKNLLVAKLFEAIESKSANLMIFALRALSKIDPDIFRSKVEDLRKHHASKLTDKVLQALESDFSFLHVANLGKIEHSGLSMKQSEKLKGKSAFDEEISVMVKSHDTSERKLAAELISSNQTEESVGHLIELLNDTDSGVIKAAMNAVAELKKQELLPFIFENLHKRNYEDAAAEAIIKYGEAAFPSLETIFYNSEQNLEIKLAIVKIYGKVGGQTAKEYLWSKIDYPDKNVISQVLISLSHCGFSAAENQIQRIKQYLEEDIANLIWNLKAIEKLKSKDQAMFRSIIESLKEENLHNYDHLYMMLSMIYDQKSIQLVKENIETKTSEGISYAIELLDVFLSEDLKQKIIPILDDTSDLDRIRRLQMYYPSIETSTDDLLRLLINREFNEVNRWTKASLLHLIGAQKITQSFDLELISNLFNPDELIREVAAWSMYNIDEEFYKEHIGRLEESERNHLQNLILGQKFEFASELRPHMKFEIVNFLKHKSLLEELPSYILSHIIDFADEVYLEDKAIINPSDWHNGSFYIVKHGRLEVKSALGELIDKFDEGEFLGEQINLDLMEENISFGISGDTLLLKIDKNKFLDLITNEYEVTIKLLESFSMEDEMSHIS